MRPRKKVLLYCPDDLLESRLRLVLQTRLSVVVFSVVEQPEVVDLPGFIEAAVVWQNSVGKDLSERLRGNGVDVLEVALPLHRALPGQKVQYDIAGLVDYVKMIVRRKPGPQSRRYCPKRMVMEAMRSAA